MKKGVVLGPYRLIRRLATGGMAEIFLAQREGKEGFARELVVKRILPHLAADPEFRRMFRDEARLAALLSHPNVVHVYDFGSANEDGGEADDGEDLYLAMELVRGVDLRALVMRAVEEARVMGRPWPVPPHHAAKIASFVCEALAHAHEIKIDGQHARIVHRDVTPSNVLVSFEGAVKLADFGIAKAAQKGRGGTDHGVVKGKYTYLSPEQARGEALDGRSDLFNVGILLVEMLLGEPLFPPDQHKEAKRMSASGQIPGLSRLSKMPPTLASIARRALSVRREDRYPDALSLRAELEAWLRSSPVPSDTVEIGRFVRDLFPDAVAEDAKGARAAGTVPLTMALLTPSNKSALAVVGTAPLTRTNQLPAAVERSSALAAEAPPPRGLSDAPTSLERMKGAFEPMPTTPLTIAGSVTPVLPRARPARASAWLAGAAILAVGVLGAAYVAMGTGPSELPPRPTALPPVPEVSTPAVPATLRVTSEPPGLRVHLDDREAGRAPILLSAEAAVRHTVDVRDDEGNVLASQLLVPEAGMTLDVHLHVEEVNASVRVASRPEGATVQLDGVEVGRTPMELAVLPGDHTVALALEGYESETDVVHVERAGESLALAFSLLPVAEEEPEVRTVRGGGRRHGGRTEAAPRATGFLVIATVPTWSRVFLGSRDLGVTPLRTELPVGRHHLTLRSDEHGSRSVDVEIREGETTRTRVSL